VQVQAQGGNRATPCQHTSIALASPRRYGTIERDAFCGKEGGSVVQQQAEGGPRREKMGWWLRRNPRWRIEMTQTLFDPEEWTVRSETALDMPAFRRKPVHERRAKKDVLVGLATLVACDAVLAGIAFGVYTAWSHGVFT
jgi:hypothetical protein